MALYGKDVWLVGPENKAKHEKLFASLKPVNGKLSGEQSKRYFMKSNLPTPVLGQIWSLADLDKDGRMTAQEFTIAVHLIENKLKGIEIPRVLPATLKQSTDPSYHGFSDSNMPMQPMQSSFMMNGSAIQAMPASNMYGIPSNNMNMQMPPNIGMPMNYGSSFTTPTGTMNRTATLPNYTSGFHGHSMQQATRTLSQKASTQSDNSPNTPVNSPVYNYSKTLPVNKSAFDSLALDKLTDLGSINKSSGTVLNVGDISAPVRLKYAQMFKSTDSEKKGLLTGEQARTVLLQTGVNPQLLVQIWELSDVNKDGSLELDEFVIAMHLVDVVKSGASLPNVLPSAVIPPHLRNVDNISGGSGAMSAMTSMGDAQASRERSGSITESAQSAATFEERRRMNWDKGQQELERRRRELLERQQAEKEAQEQKEREIEEQKRAMREEAEKKRLQELENERLRREEMEMEEERRRKEMIEKQLAAQLEAERQRQKEWESRRKEELMNQKGLEENIVNELKSRLEKLKGDLVSETTNRDTLSSTYEQKKSYGREIQAQIEQLNKSRELRIQEITRLQGVLQQSKNDLSVIIDEREKFTLELNQTDSTTTSEALGAIKSSVQQMKLGVTLLRRNITSIEAETVQVLQESNEINKQQKELKDILKEHLDERARLKQECEQKKRDEYERLRIQEQNRRRLEAQEKKQENQRKTFEGEAKKRLEREEEAMNKEKQIQGTSQRQRQAAGYTYTKPTQVKQLPDLSLKLQTNLLKNKDEIMQKQQDDLQGSAKVPPARPRTRPQGSPTKQPLTIPKVSAQTNENDTINKFEAAFPDMSLYENTFAIDSSAVKDTDANMSMTSSSLSGTNISGKSKKPPPRPKLPTSKADENKQKDEEMRKAMDAEKDRLEKEKEKIAQLKKEEVEKERKAAEEKRKEREEHEREGMERNEKLRKEADVKRKVEEMQRKRLEKKNMSSPKVPPDSSGAVESFSKKTTYKMVFNFEARNPDELTLSEGSIVQVDESYQAPSGWMYGTCNGVSGLFPENYAQKVQAPRDDYVDLDTAATLAVAMNKENTTTTTQKVTSQNQVVEQKADEMPKLKPIPRTTSRKGSMPSTPKVALLPPKGPLKAQLTPLSEQNSESVPSKIKQTKRSTIDKEAVKFPSYDLIPSAQNAGDDNYATPPKATQVGQANDVYAVTGEVITSSGGFDVCQVIALYRYQAQKEDHLSFDKNDYINVQQKQDQWWFGECNGKSGWFPKSYVKSVGTGTLKSVSPELRGSMELLSTTPATQNEECVALFDYIGMDGDLSFVTGDVITVKDKNGEWWEGTLHGKSGMFPANYVEVKEPEASKKAEVAQVITAYSAGGDNEISLKVGQLVHVMQKEGDWWQGELQVRGKSRPTGWFPQSHVKLMSTSLKSERKKTSTVTPPATTITTDYHNPQEDIYSAPVMKRKDQPHVLAMFSYTAQNDDELTFCKGSVINVLSKDGDWWKGEVNQQVGVFPYNYVQELRSDKPEETSQWSGSFDSTVLKSMSPTERQRQNHIYELIKTEEDYVTDLSLTLEVFYNPLAENKVLTEAELHTVFINWKELIMCNMKFLKALLVRKKMSRTDKIEGIGDVLIEQLPRFSPYIRFCSCMLKACRLLQDKVEKDPEFKSFEKKCAGDRRLKQNLPLSSYLLKPLQRVTKYPLIITGILNYTPEDYFDRENLMIAFDKAEDLCSEINEAVRSQESSNRLEWLQERVNLDGLDEKLIFNSQTNCLGQRKYLFHGTLHKHKSNKELKAFLFNDFLLLCRVQSNNLITKTSVGMFHPDDDTKFSIYKKPIFLNEVIVKAPSDPDVNDTLFHVTHIDRVYSFRAESKVLRNSWVSEIQVASQKFIETEREKRTKASRVRSLGDSELGRLVVTIIEGTDLQASDPTGTSDPYCEVSIGSQEHKTKVIPKDLNPKWNSTMVFHIKDMEKDVLCISVFDRDFFSPNDFLGRTEVTVASIMEKGKGPTTRRLLLHEVEKGEIVVTLELQNLKMS